MRQFGSGLAFNCENRGFGILKLAAFETGSVLSRLDYHLVGGLSDRPRIQPIEMNSPNSNYIQMSANLICPAIFSSDFQAIMQTQIVGDEA